MAGCHDHAEIILPLTAAACELIWPPDAPNPQRCHAGEREICVIGTHCAHRLRWTHAGNVAIVRVGGAVLRQFPSAATHALAVYDFATLARGDVVLWDNAATLREVTANPGAHPEVYLNSLGTLFAAHVFRAYRRSGRAPAGGNTLTPIQLKRVTDFIESNLHRTFPVDDLAALVELSTCHFIRKFKDSTGLPPHQFVIRARVERAHEYLRTGNFRVADAATEVGFCDQSHLDRYFRRYFGFPPSQLLKQRHAQF